MIIQIITLLLLSALVIADIIMHKVTDLTIIIVSSLMIWTVAKFMGVFYI